jgi:DNA mismatch repair protein MutL
MSIIKLLPEHLVNQIAAGEVIERPSCVVKELLENSLDASATHITLEIDGAGDERITVTDNGYGMGPKDALLALERHATSKIESQEDLSTIKTMGFRGEAIASIASVSHLALQTKRKEDETGIAIRSIAGTIEHKEECACPKGTQITMKNLFFNTPARKKYLKSMSTEYRSILKLFQRIALINMSTHFKLVHDNSLVADYPPVEKLTERVKQVLGKHTADNIMDLQYESNGLFVNGVIGKPELGRKGTKHQYLYVNGRPIKHNLFSYSLAESYRSLLMDRKKPFFVINIKVNPELIDVNVHPRKLEIRFRNQSHIFAVLRKATKNVLDQNNLMPSLELSSQVYKEIDSTDTNEQTQYKAPLTYNHSRPAKLNKYSYTQEEKNAPSMMPLAQIAKSYILAENENGLILIDQHAAHERIRFEELMDQFEHTQKQKQQLLLPINIELSPHENEILKKHINTISTLGFDIEEFGKNTYIIRSVPAIIDQENTESILFNVISDLADNKPTHAVTDPQKSVIEYMACRSAIKFGKSLSHEEMIELIRQLDNLKRPYTCPHGRPSMIQVTFDELEKRFKRK